MPPKRPPRTPVPPAPDAPRVDTANEQTVLAASLARPDASVAVVRRVTPSEFLDVDHQVLWSVFRELVNRGSWYDPATARRVLYDLPTDVENGGVDRDKVAAYLGDIEDMARALGDVDLKQRVETLRWDATRHRALTEGVPDVIKALATATADPASTRARARRFSDSLNSVSSREVVDPDQHLRDYAAELHKRTARGGKVFGLGGSWEQFDSCLGIGFGPGMTSVIIGVTSVGKSSVLMEWSARFVDQNRSVAYMAWEETPVSLSDTMAAATTGIPYEKIQRGDLSDEERRRVLERVRHYTRPGAIKFVNNPFMNFIQAERPGDRRGRGGGPTNIENLQVLAGLVAEAGCDVVIYDMWERCVVDGDPHRVGKMLEYTQQLHKDYGVHGIIAAQVNIADVEKQGKRTPGRADVKGVKKIVETADLFFILDRPGQFIEGVDDKMDILCQKQRHGRSPWRVRCRWDGAHKKVSDAVLQSGATSKDGGIYAETVAMSGDDEIELV